MTLVLQVPEVCTIYLIEYVHRHSRSSLVSLPSLKSTHFCHCDLCSGPVVRSRRQAFSPSCKARSRTVCLLVYRSLLPSCARCSTVISPSGPTWISGPPVRFLRPKGKPNLPFNDLLKFVSSLIYLNTNIL